MKNAFKISVIIPVYNVQDYLDDCLQSVVSQTLGFDSIQLVLVNDASTDDTAAICRRFVAEHPINTIYIEKPHSGVSAARNSGMSLAEGELITFLDGDDKWSDNAFETAYNAYISHPNISIFSCKMIFFDGESGEHQLNYKYSGDKVIDIRRDYNYPQLSSSSVFIKTSDIGLHRFAEGLKYSEDFRFINEVLFDKPQMMLLKDPIYWYRKRSSFNSAMQKSVTDPSYYIPTCQQVYKYLFDRSKDCFGYVLRYLQFCVMYDLRWRLKVPLEDSGLFGDEAKEYCDLLTCLLQDIDDDIILEQKRIALALQFYALELKHGKPVSDELSVDNTGLIRYKSYPVFALEKQPIVTIKSVALNSESVEVKGQINYPFSDERFKIQCLVNNVLSELHLFQSNDNSKTYIHGTLKSNISYDIYFPINYSVMHELCFVVFFGNKRFYTVPEYMTSTVLDKANGEYIHEGLTAYRRGSVLYIKRYSSIKSLLRKLRRRLSGHGNCSL